MGNEKKVVDFSQLSSLIGEGHISLISDDLGNYLVTLIYSIQYLKNVWRQTQMKYYTLLTPINLYRVV